MTELLASESPQEYAEKRIEILRRRLHTLRFRAYHRASEGYSGWEQHEEVPADD